MNKTIFNGKINKRPGGKIFCRRKCNGNCQIHTCCESPFRRDGEQNADFISCVAFGKTAEFIEKYITQGRRDLYFRYVSRQAATRIKMARKFTQQKLS